MRNIKKIYNAPESMMGDLVTYTPLPSYGLEQIDPFLLLNDHGPVSYKPDNNGLPFGPHPHRGMETVTFIVDGVVRHQDSQGFESAIESGGVQWMTAGKGLIHAETSTEEFKEKGGDLHILQLWLNLPAKHKLTEPFYQGLQKEDIPQVHLDDNKVKINLIAGDWDDQQAAFQPLTDVHIRTIEMQAGGKLSTTVPVDKNIFFYVIKGKVRVNNTEVVRRQLVNFENNEEELNIEALEDALILFGHATPFNETVVAHGPFVMNSREEIQEAYDAYKNGELGVWEK